MARCKTCGKFGLFLKLNSLGECESCAAKRARQNYLKQGMEAAKEELFADLSRDYMDGITFSGGDPLCPANRETVGRLIAEIRDRFPQKTIWLYTGDLFESFRDTLPFLPLIDVIVDGPYVEALRDVNLRWRGSKNQRVIDVKQTLATGKVVLWARN